jgi:D-amino-acid oxidase
MIDTDVYLRWLLAEAQRAGCCIVPGKVSGPLRTQIATLSHQYGVDAIINCTGLGAGELAEDPVFPVRGALIRMRNDGMAMPRITQAHCISRQDSSADRGFLFILPRGDDMIVLGGFAEPDEWSLNVGLDDYEPIRAMYRRCCEFLPILQRGELDAAEPVRVGLRPFRGSGVRVERGRDVRIIHNYGHGGSGVTLSWGCALEVTELAKGLFGDQPAIAQSKVLATH